MKTEAQKFDHDYSTRFVANDGAHFLDESRAVESITDPTDMESHENMLKWLDYTDPEGFDTLDVKTAAPTDADAWREARLQNALIVARARRVAQIVAGVGGVAFDHDLFLSQGFDELDDLDALADFYDKNVSAEELRSEIRMIHDLPDRGDYGWTLINWYLETQTIIPPIQAIHIAHHAVRGFGSDKCELCEWIENFSKLMEKRK